MGVMEIDLTGPDPVHEAAYNRVRRLVADHKRKVDAWVALGPEGMRGNLTLGLIRKDPGFVRLRSLWAGDEVFRGYLKEKLTFHYGADYTKRLIAIFLA